MSFLSRLFGKSQAEPEPSFEVVIQVGRGSVRYSERPSDPGDPEKCWVAAGRTVSVQGYDIPGGLVYVGEHLAGIGPWSGVEPALINPKLPADRSRPDREGEGMGYWPSYSEIPSSCRAAYLEWLAGGRIDPRAYIGYVFIFFYGLERRAISDARKLETARRELPLIREEAQRLLSLYSHNRSFKSYASRFIDLLDATLATNRRGYETEPPAPSDSWEVPLQLKIGLAHLALDAHPMPTAWAIAWLECDPETHLRTPAKRCRDEFRRLFELRYKERHGDGLVLKPNKTKVSAHYRPASASFGSTVDVPVGDLPDLTALAGPVRKVRDIADQCCNELDAYSRWLGRNAESRGSLAAVALLPNELAHTAQGAEVDALLTWLEGSLRGVERTLVNASELITRWPSAKSEKLTKAESVLMAQFLQRRGFAIEPDVRFGGPSLSVDMKVLLFRLASDSPSAPSPPYVGATALLHLAAAVSASDGSISETEEELLERHMEASLDLTPGEPERLSAHLQWLLAAPPSLTGLKKRLTEFKDSQRETIGRFLVTVAGADGRISPAEITTLSKIYRLLGLESDLVFSHVHALSTAPATEPVTIRPAEPSEGARAIPRPPSVEREFTLDMEAIAAKLDETAAVAALLGDVFADDEAEPAVASPPKGEAVAGLDPLHSAFLRALVERSTWDRNEMEELAARIGVLPDGAIDLVNDAALEKVGDPLCEGEETIQIDRQVLEELLS
jgi:uncharacterized tellurite resistance protein B-like protein